MECWSKSKIQLFGQKCFGRDRSLLLNNLCMILPRILNSISKQRSQDPTSIYLRDNDQKNTLMLSKVHMRNEILEQALIIQLKVHKQLAFRPHTPILYILDVFCLETALPPVCSTLFCLTKSFA